LGGRSQSDPPLTPLGRNGDNFSGGSVRMETLPQGGRRDDGKCRCEHRQVGIAAHQKVGAGDNREMQEHGVVPVAAGRVVGRAADAVAPRLRQAANNPPARSGDPVRPGGVSGWPGRAKICRWSHGRQSGRWRRSPRPGAAIEATAEHQRRDHHVGVEDGPRAVCSSGLGLAGTRLRWLPPGPGDGIGDILLSDAEFRQLATHGVG
jgi:hypothetical protein